TWRGALLIWVTLSILALLVWLVQLKNRDRSKVRLQNQQLGGLFKSSLAWKITVFMGAQSLIFYTLITWLPTILTANGYDIHLAGWGVFIFQFASIPFTFIIPVIADRMKNQVMLAFVCSGLILAGIIGLLAGLSEVSLLLVV